MIERRSELASTTARELALSCIEVGIEASDPKRVIEETVALEQDTLVVAGDEYDLAAYDEILVVGGGKASGRQAVALESILDDRIDDGVIVTVESVELESIGVRIGDHPVPSERGEAATRDVLARLTDTTADTLVIALITGGGSALLPAPTEGITLESLQEVTQSLLDSGATIHEINAVRKHLSDTKGGGLARTAAPAQVIGLLMSDVVGNDQSVIASGPTVADESTFKEAMDVLERYEIDILSGVRERLAAGVDGRIEETPGPGDPAFDRVSNYITADGTTPIRAAMAYLDTEAYTAHFLSSRIRGEAREAAKTHVAIGEEIRSTGHPIAPPAVVLSGGETTVTMRGNGQGGPNQEFVVSGALEGLDGITLAAIDTDGIDGASPAAGGIVDDTTLDDVGAARRALADNDVFSYLNQRNGVLKTGATGTNVNDFRVMVVDPVDG